jgi:ABC-2 type transport system permease protein
VKGKAKVGWDIPGLSGPVAAIVEKEFHYLSRSGPMLFTFIMPIVVLLIFRFSSARAGGSADLLARASDLAFPVGAAYAVLILTNLIYNSFGGDAVGVQFFFLSPVRFRDVFIGKNIAHMVVVAIELLLVWLAVCVLYRMPAIDLTIATICGVAFAVLVSLSVGDLFSMHSPKKIDYGTLGRQQASGTTAIASLGIQAVVIGLCASVLLLARSYGRIWIAIVGFLTLAVAAGIAYGLVLNRTDSIALKNRETMIAELSRA